MIYDIIEFEADPFSYFLEFADRITLVRGDSATGKTYLYQMLEDLRMTKEYQAIKLFNYKTEDFHENLKKCKDRFVVIDNADLLLDDEDRRFINFDLNLSAGSFMLLYEDNYKVSLKREMVAV